MAFLPALLAHFISQGYDMTSTRKEVLSSLTIQLLS